MAMACSRDGADYLAMRWQCDGNAMAMQWQGYGNDGDGKSGDGMQQLQHRLGCLLLVCHHGNGNGNFGHGKCGNGKCGNGNDGDGVNKGNGNYGNVIILLSWRKCWLAMCKTQI